MISIIKGEEDEFEPSPFTTGQGEGGSILSTVKVLSFEKDDFKNLLLPVIKRTGRTGSDGTIAPETSLDYLFVPALTEYIGQNAAATYNVNARESRQYQAYVENLAVQKQPRRIYTQCG